MCASELSEKIPRLAYKVCHSNYSACTLVYMLHVYMSAYYTCTLKYLTLKGCIFVSKH